jgi:hypothetical protein
MDVDVQALVDEITPLIKRHGQWQDRGNGHFWLDHVSIDEEGVRQLQSASWMTLWNVDVPDDFYTRLPNLRELEIDGGSARHLAPVRSATQVTRLVINQVRSVVDLGWLASLDGLESLALFGLPKVTAMPSLRRLRNLRFVQVGQMVRLHDVSGIADAPALEELRFTQRLAVTPESMVPFLGHPTLARFGWSWDEGVPAARGRAVLDALSLPRPDWNS